MTQFSSTVSDSAEAYMRWRFMSNWVSAANQFLLPNRGACNESVFVVESCWIMVSVANQISLSNRGVCSKLVFAAESYRIMVSAANQFSLLNCDVCSKSVFAAELYYLQRISFRCWILMSIANHFSLPNYVSPANKSSLLNSESLTNEFSLLIFYDRLPWKKWLKCL
jgi:hypothetical protein